MTSEPDESRMWKYLELPTEFKLRSIEVDVTCKQHMRVIERLAKHLAREKPKTAQEFERVEYLKDFCVKSAQLNEQVIGLLEYLTERLNEMYRDYKQFAEGARSVRIIRDQDERLKVITRERDELQNQLNDARFRKQDQTAS